MSGTGTHSDYSQNDPAWKDHLIGFSTGVVESGIKLETFGLFGCFEAAMANVASAQGEQINPSQVNDALKAHGLFKRDAYGQIADIAGYSALAAITPHSHFIEQKNWPANIVAPAAYFNVEASTTTEIIIMIDSHPEEAGIQSHYVRVVGLANNGSDIEIVDSWDGQRKLLSTYSHRNGAKKNPFQIIWSAGKYLKV